MISEPVRTGDGSLTRRHHATGQLYHARDGARTETEAKFILPSHLAERLQAGPVRLLDIGFGMGYTCLQALSLPAPHGIRIDTLEMEAEVFDEASGCHPPHPLFAALRDHGEWESEGRKVVAHLGDLRQTLHRVPSGVDLIFHDPFAPLVNTEAWTREIFARLAALLNPGGLLLTYSQSRIVRASLHAAGFRLGTTPARPPHRGGTVAAIPPTILQCPLSEPAGGWGPPFEDPDQNASATTIRSRREALLRQQNQNN